MSVSSKKSYKQEEFISSLTFVKNENQDKELDLVEIRQENLVYGPLDRVHLDELLSSYEDFPANVEIRSYGTNQSWKPIFETPYFHRRQPKVLTSSEKTLDEKESLIYLLIEGIKQGPFDFKTIHSLIQEKKILITDLISLDEGKTFYHLYEFKEFERRRCPLPQKLTQEPSFSTSVSSNPQINDTLASLVYLGTRQNKEKEQEKEDILLSNDSYDKVKKQHSFKGPIMTLVVASVATTFVFLNNNKKDVSRNPAESVAKIPQKRKKIVKRRKSRNKLEDVFKYQRPQKALLGESHYRKLRQNRIHRQDDEYNDNDFDHDVQQRGIVHSNTRRTEDKESLEYDDLRENDLERDYEFEEDDWTTELVKKSQIKQIGEIRDDEDEIGDNAEWRDLLVDEEEL